MKRLTKGQRFALAREARRLAMECVEGTAVLAGWPRCAAGQVGLRTGVLKELPSGFAGMEWYEFADLLGAEEARTVARANDDADSFAESRNRVVFPLLALADALEASAASVPQAPPEVP